MTKILGIAAGALVAGLVVAVLLGWLVAAIWNFLPMLEGIQHLSWWDGTLLLLLSNMLFKSNTTSK